VYNPCRIRENIDENIIENKEKKQSDVQKFWEEKGYGSLTIKFLNFLNPFRLGATLLGGKAKLRNLGSIAGGFSLIIYFIERMYIN